MEPVIEHFQHYYGIYIVVAAVLLPIILVFRRYSFPAIAFALEAAIYMGITHVLVCGITRTASWFKDQSSMKRAFDVTAETDPGWRTPLVAFWDKTQYSPEWLIYMEIGLFLVVLGVTWRLRPPAPQRVKKKLPPKKGSTGFASQRPKQFSKKPKRR